MEPALKQRLVGAVVLVALAVIFLPMLIKGPAPESGAADVPLDVPPAPDDAFETRELPLVAPGAAPTEGVVGLDAREDRDDPAPGALPTVDTADGADVAPVDSDGDGILEGPLAADLADADVPDARDDAPPAEAEEPAAVAAPTEMMPPPVPGGDWVVGFGTFSTQAAAERVVAQLRASQLPGFREQARVDGRTVHRVRIGPYDSEATAQAARLRAAHVRDDVGARVIALEAAGSSTTASPAPAPAPAASEPAPPPKPAAGTGFIVQLGAFSKQGDVDALVARARGAGFNVSTQPVETDGGRLTRVLVGPAFDRAAADALKARVQAQLGIDGLVRSYP